jgi:hypothetical protein
MNSLGINLAPPSQMSAMLPMQDEMAGAMHSTGSAERTPRLAGDKSADLRERFTQFVGESFYGQMLKSMRATVGKPAYFHGGRGEEVFQGQLDQTLAEHLTEASAEQFAEPMFDRQFPHLAKTPQRPDLNELANLRRS